MNSRIRAFTLSLAVVAFLGLAAASTAGASDFCAPCVTPIAYEPVVAQTPLYCDICAAPALARTNLPGYYSNDYDYVTSSRYDTGITYIVPTMNGYIESPTIPLTNAVDRYYATHVVSNGQVVDLTRSQGGLMASVPSQSPALVGDLEVIDLALR